MSEKEENTNESLEESADSNNESPQKGPFQKKLFWFISTGNNSSQLILLNFFQFRLISYVFF